MVDPQWGHFIHALLSQGNLTQTKLAREVGVEGNITVYRWLHGRAKPQRRFHQGLQQLAQQFQIPANYWPPELRQITLPLLILPRPSSDETNEVEESIILPIVHDVGVAAGEPMLAEQNIVGYAPAPCSLVKQRDAFYVPVRGDSMVGAGIEDGDYALVCRQPTADSGQIVVALLGHEEATLKRLVKKQGALFLQPENPKFQPIPVTPDMEIAILGIVIAVRRGNKVKKL